MCGEHHLGQRRDRLVQGSSPHVRGALEAAVSAMTSLGIIPACAGSTFRASWTPSVRRDHPRMCGEHPVPTGETPQNPGSSPHVRGAPCRNRLRGICSWDHPRMCGEHRASVRGGGQQPGSSPHVRGARRGIEVGGDGRGIIPACAGSTQARPIPSPASRDHPRMCGEHGSHDRSVLVGDGIIPACAGSTSRRSARTARRWDHPRMCGEHTPFLYVDSASEGSSPHVRGALGFEDFHDFNVGIIPACAGST